MDKELLQALRNITREHMRLVAQIHNCSIDDTRDVVCIAEALSQLTQPAGPHFDAEMAV